ncbi:hypothetical protein EDEG_01368 [Edhazardia aedis USNM 41457]|uniref:Uncharacterized protein n=1 Tax=Edhazardia aedis (strain USNM 41457) TaxID=1003232 RepID=J8ZXH9_EDHAE|nr:hypothetical protein EDEG_01368 [Edhazardia aedis USNM 41457]|eukprot:EJW04393.1 hypothetical protein EDEG_01368 [Edhazardia aedis USNM 41457]
MINTKRSSNTLRMYLIFSIFAVILGSNYENINSTCYKETKNINGFHEQDSPITDTNIHFDTTEYMNFENKKGEDISKFSEEEIPNVRNSSFENTCDIETFLPEDYENCANFLISNNIFNKVPLSNYQDCMNPDDELKRYYTSFKYIHDFFNSIYEQDRKSTDESCKYFEGLEYYPTTNDIDLQDAENQVPANFSNESNNHSNFFLNGPISEARTICNDNNVDAYLSNNFAEFNGTNFDLYANQMCSHQIDTKTRILDYSNNGLPNHGYQNVINFNDQKIQPTVSGRKRNISSTLTSESAAKKIELDIDCEYFEMHHDKKQINVQKTHNKESSCFLFKPDCFNCQNEVQTEEKCSSQSSQSKKEKKHIGKKCLRLEANMKKIFKQTRNLSNKNQIRINWHNTHRFLETNNFQAKSTRKSNKDQLQKIQNYDLPDVLTTLTPERNQNPMNDSTSSIKRAKKEENNANDIINLEKNLNKVTKDKRKNYRHGRLNLQIENTSITCCKSKKEITNSINILNKFVPIYSSSIKVENISFHIFLQKKLKSFSSEVDLILEQAEKVSKSINKTKQIQDLNVVNTELLKIFIIPEEFALKKIKIRHLWLVLIILYPEIHDFISFLVKDYLRLPSFEFNEEVNLNIEKKHKNSSDHEKIREKSEKIKKIFLNQYIKMFCTKKHDLYENLKTFFVRIKELIEYLYTENKFETVKLCFKEKLSWSSINESAELLFLQKYIQSKSMCDAFLRVLIAFPDRILSQNRKFFYFKLCYCHIFATFPVEQNFDFLNILKYNCAFGLPENLQNKLEAYIDGILENIFTLRLHPENPSVVYNTIDLESQKSLYAYCEETIFDLHLKFFLKDISYKTNFIFGSEFGVGSINTEPDCIFKFQINIEEILEIKKNQRINSFKSKKESLVYNLTCLSILSSLFQANSQ